MRNLALFALFGASIAMGDGVIAFKSHNLQDDKDAKVIVYKKLNTDSEITWVETTDNKRFSLDLNQFKEWIDIPQIPPTIISENEKKYVTEVKNKVSLFVQKFPASGKPLKLVLESLNTIQNRIETGQVRLEGEWMESPQYQKIVDDRAKSEIITRRIAEAKQIEEQKRLKASMDAERAAIEAESIAAKVRLGREEDASKKLKALQRKQKLEELDLRIASIVNSVSAIRERQAQKIQLLNETAISKNHN